MGSRLSTMRTLFAIILVASLVVGALSAAVFFGACTMSDQVSCSVDGAADSNGTDGQEGDADDGLAGSGDTDSPSDSDTGDSDGGSSGGENGNDDDEGGTGDEDDPGNDGESGTGDEDDTGDDETGTGDDEEDDENSTAPAYPPRTSKSWDRTITFPEDPGETVASGDDWAAASEAVERYVATLINDYRAEQGLDRLEYSHALAGVSRAHSRDMYERNYFDHENPDGERAWDRWGHSECRDSYGENIFESWAGVPLTSEPEPLYTAEALANNTLDGWQNSPPHDEAMRDPKYDAVGYGVYFGPTRDRDYGYQMLVTMNMCEYN